MENYRAISDKLIRVNVLRRLLVQKNLRGKNLFKGQFPIMEIICENEGCTQKFLADQLMVSSASIALSIKRLVKAGMIEKTADENNLRCNRIYPTEKGRKSKEEACSVHAEIDQRTYRGFSAEEKAQLDAFLLRMIKNLESETDSVTLYALHNRLLAEEQKNENEKEE